MLQLTKSSIPLRGKISLTAGQLGIISTSRFFVFRRDYFGKPSQMDSPQLKIRLISPQDIPQISQKLTFDFNKNFSRSAGGMVATIQGEIVHWSLFGRNRVYVEMLDGDIRLDSDSAYVFSMYTDPKHRGQRISGSVLDAICSYLYPEGITKFYVFITTSNFSSMKSASKANFRRIGLVQYFRLLNFRLFKITGNTETTHILRGMLNVRAPAELCYVR